MNIAVKAPWGPSEIEERLYIHQSRYRKAQTPMNNACRVSNTGEIKYPFHRHPSLADYRLIGIFRVSLAQPRLL